MSVEDPFKGKRWSSKQSDYLDDPPEIRAFISDIFVVYKKHGLSIAHEDSHGGFLIETDDAENRQWLEGATDNR